MKRDQNANPVVNDPYAEEKTSNAADPTAPIDDTTNTVSASGPAPRSGLASAKAFLAADDPATGLRIWFGDDLTTLTGHRLRAAVDRDIAEIDAKISEIVEAIISHDRFMRLEGSWGALHWLVGSISTPGRARSILVRILNLSLRELDRDITKSPEFDQTQLFHKVHDQEFGIAGGTPFGLMVADYDIQHRPLENGVDPIALLRDVAKVGSSAFCPFVFSATPGLFGVDRMNDLTRRENIRATFEQVDYARLKSFQESDEARFIAITAGRLLYRQPYRGRRHREFGYIHYANRNEGIGREIWISAGYGIAFAAIRAYREFSWPAAMRGAPERDGREEIAGGVIDPLTPAHFATDRPGVAAKIGVEANLTERQEAELNSLGFIAPRSAPFTEYSVFYNVPTAQRVKTAHRNSDNYSARMGAMLNYVICVSRFAHYVKIIVREWVGSYKSAQECEILLNKWIGAYCIANDDTGYRERARFPLRRAKITVSEDVGKPGAYHCGMQLQPHFQLDYIVSEFELTTKIETSLDAD